MFVWEKAQDLTNEIDTVWLTGNALLLILFLMFSTAVLVQRFHNFLFLKPCSSSRLFVRRSYPFLRFSVTEKLRFIIFGFKCKADMIMVRYLITVRLFH